MKLHLVDATYELFRAFFGAPPRTAPDGMEVGATVGIAESILGLLRQEDVTHVACATDQVIESFRNKLFDGYKTGEGMEPTLWAQFPLAEEVLTALGVRVWPMVEFEADDALAAGAAQFRDQVEQVQIMTPDKDLAQCVIEDRVVLVDRRRQLTYDEQGVWAKWGVAPGSIPDYLALVGDNADGIPGIPAWGAKSASSVLARYRSLEAIPDNPQEWDVKVRGAKRLAANLAEQRDNATLYRTLATLRTDVDLGCELEDLRWQGADQAALAQCCERLGYPRLLERVHRFR